MVYNHGKHEIEIFDSIQSLPILRFQKFNKYQMMASEIGNSIQDHDKRTAKALEFFKKDMKEEGIQELQNLRMTVFNGLNEFTPTGKSLAVLVKRIDNVAYETYAPDDLDRCLAHLDKIGFDYGKAIEKLSEVKKKSKRNFLSITRKYFRKIQIWMKSR